MHSSNLFSYFLDLHWVSKTLSNIIYILRIQEVESVGLGSENIFTCTQSSKAEMHDDKLVWGMTVSINAHKTFIIYEITSKHLFQISPFKSFYCLNLGWSQDLIISIYYPSRVITIFTHLFPQYYLSFNAPTTWHRGEIHGHMQCSSC